MTRQGMGGIARQGRRPRFATGGRATICRVNCQVGGIEQKRVMTRYCADQNTIPPRLPIDLVPSVHLSSHISACEEGFPPDSNLSLGL